MSWIPEIKYTCSNPVSYIDEIAKESNPFQISFSAWCQKPPKQPVLGVKTSEAALRNTIAI